MAGGPFRFRFAAVLKYRSHRRDLVRLVFAQILARRQELIEQRSQMESDRQSQFSRMRELAGPGSVDVEGVSTRRFHSGRILGDIATVDQEIHLTDQQLSACRAALVAAEQDVEVLEKLEARQRTRIRSRAQPHPATRT